MKAPVVILSLIACVALGPKASAEIRTMTLKQALEMALSQNPDILSARLDQQKAHAQITIAKDAFLPKVSGGSGLAYTRGVPQTIGGSAPSIIQVQTQMAIFNRPQSYQVAQANEAARGTEIDVAAKQDEIAYRVASLFLDAERASQSLGAAERQVQNLERAKELMEARVTEGRELPIEAKVANLSVLRSRDSVEQITLDLINAETFLAQVLGMSPDDRVRASSDERASFEMPSSEERSIENALENSKELKKLESNLQGKILEIKEHQSERLPKVSLVAQYSLLSPFNNFKDYYTKFQYNNFQFGASFEIPLLMGRAPGALASQAKADMDKLRIEVNRTRSRITADLRRAYQEIRRAQNARDLARADLDLARERLDLNLAQYEEGRLPMARVEEQRATENEKWLAYYNSQHSLEIARLNVLRQTGTVVAALR